MECNVTLSTVLLPDPARLGCFIFNPAVIHLARLFHLRRAGLDQPHWCAVSGSLSWGRLRSRASPEGPAESRGEDPRLIEIEGIFISVALPPGRFWAGEPPIPEAASCP